MQACTGVQMITSHWNVYSSMNLAASSTNLPEDKLLAAAAFLCFLSCFTDENGTLCGTMFSVFFHTIDICGKSQNGLRKLSSPQAVVTYKYFCTLFSSHIGRSEQQLGRLFQQRWVSDNPDEIPHPTSFVIMSHSAVME